MQVEIDFDPGKFMTVKHHYIGGIYTKEMHLPAGVVFAQHQHTYDHQSVLASGSVLLDVDGDIQKLHAPAIVNIKARTPHSIVPLTAAVWLCQHRVSEDDMEEQG